MNLWESKNMGNYRLVFSEKNSKLYEKYFYLNESSLYRRPQLLQQKPPEIMNRKEVIIY